MFRFDQAIRTTQPTLDNNKYLYEVFCEGTCARKREQSHRHACRQFCQAIDQNTHSYLGVVISVDGSAMGNGELRKKGNAEGLCATDASTAYKQGLKLCGDGMYGKALPVSPADRSFVRMRVLHNRHKMWVT